jgi:hypothetical protein
MALSAKPGLCLYRYDVTINPPVINKRKKRRVIEILLEEQRAVLANVVTDFASIIYSPHRKLQLAGNFILNYRDDDEDVARPGATKYTVTVTFQGDNTVSIGDYQAYLREGKTSSAITHNTGSDALQALNILLAWGPQRNGKISMVGANRAYSLDQRGMPLGKGIEALRGFYRSVRNSSQGFIINIQVKHGAFFKPGDLVKLYNDYGLKRLQLARFLKGVRITTNHLPERKNKSGKVIKRTKTIMGLAMRSDGYGTMNTHPPRVEEDFGNADQVKFYLETPTKEEKGKSGKSTDTPKAATGKYITVHDFFKTSKLLGEVQLRMAS